MTSPDTRQVGKHLFIFQKDNNHRSSSPTIVAKPVEVTEELPREFVKCLRTLFDILDERGTGLVKLADIEARWGVNGSANGFPMGIVESLRKVTPKSGLLSFERLCTGMKLALKIQSENSTISSKRSESDRLDKDKRCRSQSMPHLVNLSIKDRGVDSSEESLKSPPSRKDKGAIMDKLKTWQRESLRRRNSASDTCLIGGHKSYAATGSSSPEEPVITAHPVSTKVYFVGKDENLSPKTNGLPSAGSTTSELSPGKINSVHTSVMEHLSNGVHSPGNASKKLNFDKESLHTGGLVGAERANDAMSWLKDPRLQQLEDELTVLQGGLEVIEGARRWYFKRITAIQEEKLHFKHSEKYSLEQFQYEMLLHKTRRKELHLERDAFERYRSYVEELNRCLKQVTDNPQLPLQQPTKDSNNKCREQELQKELSEKTAKIAQLENEKSALIQKLFHSKPTPPPRSLVPISGDTKSF